MSENIQSISQGTFTIGQTSATNYVAGPGISISQPSEGTVRIGNDETVLWSGNVASVNGNYITLSENASGFQSIKVIMGNSTWGSVTEFPGYVTRLECQRIAADNTNATYLDYAGLFRDAENPLKWVSKGGYRLTVSGTSISRNTYSGMAAMKVIGINRISGGNE